MSDLKLKNQFGEPLIYENRGAIKIPNADGGLVEFVERGEITPIGNIPITQLGQVDVTNFATAEVTDANLISGNIKKDVEILGVSGTYKGLVPEGTYYITDTDSADVRNYAYAKVSDNNLIPENIKKGVTILDVEGTYDSSCFTSDTEITMADCSKKRVDQLHVGEMILAFDHETGRVRSTPVAYIFKAHGYYDAVELVFTNGQSICILREHYFFNREENRYVEINTRNAYRYVGREFFYRDDHNAGFVQLVAFRLKHLKTDAYSVLSARNINHFANGFLTVSDESEGLFNYFDLDEEMKYLQEEKRRHIATYGLTDYSTFAPFCTEEEFNAFNCQYLNIAIGRGITTAESIKQRMQKFLVRRLTNNNK